MTQLMVADTRSAPSRSEKFEPGVQELRTKFAHIKRELRHIQHALAAAPPPRTPQPNGPKAPTR